MFGSRSNCPARPIIGRPIRAETSPSIADYTQVPLILHTHHPHTPKISCGYFYAGLSLRTKKKTARFNLGTLRIDLVQSEPAMGNCELNFELRNVIDNSELTLRATFGYGSCKHHPRTCIIFARACIICNVYLTMMFVVRRITLTFLIKPAASPREIVELSLTCEQVNFDSFLICRETRRVYEERLFRKHNPIVSVCVRHPSEIEKVMCIDLTEISLCNYNV